MWPDSPVASPDGLLRLLHSQPKLHHALIAATTPPPGNGGRPRLPGEWAVAYLLFVISRERDLLRWWQETDDALWQRMSFTRRPLYDTAHHHFALLEEHAEGFRRIAGELIRRAVAASGGLVGRDVHVDGTEAETNARLYHDCGPDDHDCSRKGRARNRKSTSPAAKVSADTARGLRQERAELAPEELDEEIVERDVAHGRIKLSNGCWYRTSDPTAGVRLYSGRKFWHGFNNMKAVDHYTGGSLGVLVINASTNEDAAYPHLLNRVLENTGQTPRAVIGDRGLSVTDVFELNTRVGIASVFPWRKHHAGEERENTRTERYDEHGIPFCPECGAQCVFVSFSASQARLTFQCSLGTTEACHARRTISCSKNWRYLIPLWRTEEAYLVLRNSHSHYEKTHWRWRDQWLVAGDNSQTRPLRRGIACQQLRSEAALLLEWLLICHREGWLGAARENHEHPIVQHDARKVDVMKRSRMNRGLHLPAGKAREEHIAEVAKRKAANEKRRKELAKLRDKARRAAPAAPSG